MRRNPFGTVVLLVAAVGAVAVGIAAYVREQTHARSESTIQVLVDSRVSSLAAVGVPATATAIIERTPLYADYAASPPLRAMIARRAGVRPGSLSVVANTTETEASGGAIESTSYNSAPSASPRPNVVTLDATDMLPVITVKATARNLRAASTLVSATVRSLTDAVALLDRREHVKRLDQMTLRPLGSPTNRIVTGVKSKKKPAAVGVAVFVVLALVGLLLGQLVSRRRLQSRRAPNAETASRSDGIPEPDVENANETLALQDGELGKEREVE